MEAEPEQNPVLRQLHDLQQMGADLKHQHRTLNVQIQKVAARIGKTKIDAVRAEAAIESIEEAKPEAKMYRQVARLFVLEEREPLIESLKCKIGDTNNEFTMLQGVVTQLMDKRKSVETQAVDITKQMQRVASEGGGVEQSS